MADCSLDPDPAGEVLRFKISSAYLPYLKLGTIWCGQDLIGNMPGLQWVNGIELDVSKQRPIRRYDCDETGMPRFLAGAQLDEFPPYVEVPVSGPTGVSRAVVRCSELARFYFGQSSVLAQELFNFDARGRNPRLYDFGETGWAPGLARYVLALRRDVSEDDGRYLAMQLAWAAPYEALISLSRSVRRAHFMGLDAWPCMPIPCEDTTSWTILGQVRPVIFVTDDNVEHIEEVLAVTQILRCSFNRRIDELELKMPRAINAKIEDKIKFPRPTVSGVDQDLPWSGERPPGTSTRQSANVKLDVFEGCPGARIGACVVSYKEVEESPVGSYAKQVQAALKTLSAVMGGRGSDEVGDLSLSPEVPYDEKQVEADDPEQEHIDRSELPDLFAAPFPAPPRLVQVTFGLIPSEFVPVIHAAARFMKRHPGAIASWYDGSQLELEYDRGLLLELPQEWGGKIFREAGSNVLRRALCIRIRMSIGQAYVLDIERVAPRDSFGVHVMVFDHQVPIPLAVIGKVIQWRLKSKKRWPDRTTHAGRFWVRRLKHDVSVHTKVRMEGRLTTHLMSAFGSMEA